MKRSIVDYGSDVPTRRRRSSILKTVKSPRIVLAELDAKPITPTDQTVSRRVSFSRRTAVAEFVTHEATTTWKNLYEEHHNFTIDSIVNDFEVHCSGGPPRIPQDEFQEIEAELDEVPGPPDLPSTNTHGQHLTASLNLTEQFAALGTANYTTNLAAPVCHFDVSAKTDNNLKLFSDTTDFIIGEPSGVIEVDFSTEQLIQAPYECSKKNSSDVNNLEQAELDYAYVNRSTNKPKSESSPARESGEADMSLTDTAVPPCLNPPAVLQSLSNKIPLNSDWIADKENILLTPPQKIRQSTVKTQEKVLVYDGKKLKYARIDDDLDDLVVHPLPRTNKSYDRVFSKRADKSITLGVTKRNSQQPNTLIFDKDDVEANMSITQSIPSSVKHCLGRRGDGENDCDSLNPKGVSQLAKNLEKNVTVFGDNLDMSITQCVTSFKQNYTQSQNYVATDIHPDLPARVCGTSICDIDVSLAQHSPPSPRSDVISSLTNDKNVDNTSKRRTIVFDRNDVEADISITQCYSGRLLTNFTDPLKVNRSMIKAKEKILVYDEENLNNAQIDVDLDNFKNPIPELNNTYGSKNNRKKDKSMTLDVTRMNRQQPNTMIFDAEDVQANLSMTQCITSTVKYNHEDSKNGENNLQNLNLTVGCSKLIKNYKNHVTVLGDNVDMSMTQCIPSVQQDYIQNPNFVTKDSGSESPRICDIDVSIAQCSLPGPRTGVTSNLISSENVNISSWKKNNALFDKDTTKSEIPVIRYDDQHLTSSQKTDHSIIKTQEKVYLANEKKLDNTKIDDAHRKDDDHQNNYRADKSLTLDIIRMNHQQSKTLVFDKDDIEADVSMTQCIPSTVKYHHKENNEKTMSVTQCVPSIVKHCHKENKDVKDNPESSDLMTNVSQLTGKVKINVEVVDDDAIMSIAQSACTVRDVSDAAITVAPSELHSNGESNSVGNENAKHTSNMHIAAFDKDDIEADVSMTQCGNKDHVLNGENMDLSLRENLESSSNERPVTSHENNKVADPQTLATAVSIPDSFTCVTPSSSSPSKVTSTRLINSSYDNLDMSIRQCVTSFKQNYTQSQNYVATDIHPDLPARVCGTSICDIDVSLAQHSPPSPRSDVISSLTNDKNVDNTSKRRTIVFDRNDVEADISITQCYSGRLLTNFTDPLKVNRSMIKAKENILVYDEENLNNAKIDVDLDNFKNPIPELNNTYGSKNNRKKDKSMTLDVTRMNRQQPNTMIFDAEDVQANLSMTQCITSTVKYNHVDSKNGENNLQNLNLTVGCSKLIKNYKNHVTVLGDNVDMSMTQCIPSVQQDYIQNPNFVTKDSGSESPRICDIDVSIAQCSLPGPRTGVTSNLISSENVNISSWKKNNALFDKDTTKSEIPVIRYDDQQLTSSQKTDHSIIKTQEKVYLANEKKLDNTKIDDAHRKDDDHQNNYRADKSLTLDIIRMNHQQSKTLVFDKDDIEADVSMTQCIPSTVKYHHKENNEKTMSVTQCVPSIVKHCHKENKDVKDNPESSDLMTNVSQLTGKVKINVEVVDDDAIMSIAQSACTVRDVSDAAITVAPSELHSSGESNSVGNENAKHTSNMHIAAFDKDDIEADVSMTQCGNKDHVLNGENMDLSLRENLESSSNERPVTSHENDKVADPQTLATAVSIPDSFTCVTPSSSSPSKVTSTRLINSSYDNLDMSIRQCVTSFKQNYTQSQNYVATDIHPDLPARVCGTSICDIDVSLAQHSPPSPRSDVISSLTNDKNIDNTSKRRTIVFDRNDVEADISITQCYSGRLLTNFTDPLKVNRSMIKAKEKILVYDEENLNNAKIDVDLDNFKNPIPELSNTYGSKNNMKKDKSMTLDVTRMNRQQPNTMIFDAEDVQANLSMTQCMTSTVKYNHVDSKNGENNLQNLNLTVGCSKLINNYKNHVTVLGDNVDTSMTRCIPSVQQDYIQNPNFVTKDSGSEPPRICDIDVSIAQCSLPGPRTGVTSNLISSENVNISSWKKNNALFDKDTRKSEIPVIQYDDQHLTSSQKTDHSIIKTQEKVYLANEKKLDNTKIDDAHRKDDDHQNNCRADKSLTLDIIRMNHQQSKTLVFDKDDIEADVSMTQCIPSTVKYHHKENNEKTMSVTQCVPSIVKHCHKENKYVKDNPESSDLMTNVSQLTGKVKINVEVVDDDAIMSIAQSACTVRDVSDAAITVTPSELHSSGESNSVGNENAKHTSNMHIAAFDKDDIEADVSMTQCGNKDHVLNGENMDLSLCENLESSSNERPVTSHENNKVADLQTLATAGSIPDSSTCVTPSSSSPSKVTSTRLINSSYDSNKASGKMGTLASSRKQGLSYAAPASTSGNLRSQIDALPFMGSRHCEWETALAERGETHKCGVWWWFRLLHTRLRLGIRIANVAGDPVLAEVEVTPDLKDCRDSIVSLCVRLAAEAARVVCAKESRATATRTPMLLQRLVELSRLAAQWGRALHDARLSLALAVEEHGYISFNVANVPLRCVWEVKIHVELDRSEEPARTPWPRAVRVSARLASPGKAAALGAGELQSILRGVPHNWGHVPTTIWRVFRYLKNQKCYKASLGT